MWVIVYGDIFEGLQGAVGPFSNEDEAIAYMESHNLGHFNKQVYQLDPLGDEMKPGSIINTKLKDRSDGVLEYISIIDREESSG